MTIFVWPKPARGIRSGGALIRFERIFLDDKRAVAVDQGPGVPTISRPLITRDAFGSTLPVMRT